MILLLILIVRQPLEIEKEKGILKEVDVFKKSLREILRINNILKYKNKGSGVK